jgi:hypothetical protein
MQLVPLHPGKKYSLRVSLLCPSSDDPERLTTCADCSVEVSTEASRGHDCALEQGVDYSGGGGCTS